MLLLFSMYSFLLPQIVVCRTVKIYKRTKYSRKQACKGMFGKSQTGAGQCSPSFPRCYTLLPEGQEREGVSSLGQMGKCLCTYRKEWEVKSKKEPGEEVRRREKEEGE